jgi:hypothetical protein
VEAELVDSSGSHCRCDSHFYGDATTKDVVARKIWYSIKQFMDTLSTSSPETAMGPGPVAPPPPTGIDAVMAWLKDNWMMVAVAIVAIVALIWFLRSKKMM